MEFEFDKEIDALLRQAARGTDAVSTAGAHLDADEISAFAENALPEKTKFRYTAHLADCSRCRKILSNLILLESETEGAAKAVSAFEGQEFVKETIPWYRKIFAMPNLAYTMGALVLLFSGLIAFVVLQSTSNFQNAEVSQMSEKPAESKSTSSAPATSNANMASNTNSATNPAPVYASNATTANTTSVANVPLPATTANSATNRTVGETKNFPAPPPPAESRDEAIREQELDLAKTEPRKDDLNTAERAKEVDKPVTEDKTASTDADATVTARKVPKPVAQPPLATGGASINDQKEKKLPKKTGETTNVGGKTFRRSNNVWYDAAYSGQSTTNVTRGTAEYKKLDSGLRGIVENLGGTVVIVWKSKAYRIQ